MWFEVQIEVLTVQDSGGFRTAADRCGSMGWLGGMVSHGILVPWSRLTLGATA
jgi:hypothetical protein